MSKRVFYKYLDAFWTGQINHVSETLYDTWDEAFIASGGTQLDKRYTVYRVRFVEIDDEIETINGGPAPEGAACGACKSAKTCPACPVPYTR